MKITIYQINMDRDVNRVAFESLEHLSKYQGSSEVDSSLYDRVYAGEVDCTDLEDVYQMFNLNHPKDYLGRSLSVSDIVEVEDSVEVVGIVEQPEGEEHRFCDFLEYTTYQDQLREQGRDFTAHDCMGTGIAKTVSKFFFCDSVGFEEVAFQPELAGELERETLHVVLCEPGKVARITDIPAAFKAQQRVVGGGLHTYEPYNDGIVIVYNENGRLDGLAENRAIREPETVTEMDYRELKDRFRAVERSGDRKHLTGYIVFSRDSFEKEYPEASRTYAVSSDNKAFQPNMGGYSIFGSAIDGSDPLVRLECYMADEKGGSGGWRIERCYMKEPGKEIMEVIAGTFFVCRSDGEQFASLDDEQARKYQELFKLPEQVFRDGDSIEAIPYKPSDKSKER